MYHLHITVEYTKDGSKKKGVTTQSYDFDTGAEARTVQKALANTLFDLGDAQDAAESKPTVKK